MSCESCLFQYGDYVCLRGSMESPCSCFVNREEVEAYLRGKEPTGAGKDADEGEESGRPLPQNENTLTDKGKHRQSRTFLEKGGDS